MPDLALFQPDIPQNTGTLLRLGACLGVTVHVIGPAGFDLSSAALRRAGLDYLPKATLVHHVSWTTFQEVVGRRRILLATTRAARPYTDFAYAADDLILLGRESAGVPEEVHARADARVLIPMRSGMRSINVALSGAMILGEALRQTSGFPVPPHGLEGADDPA